MQAGVEQSRQDMREALTQSRTAARQGQGEVMQIAFVISANLNGCRTAGIYGNEKGTSPMEQ
jgi:hypothetical protein